MIRNGLIQVGLLAVIATSAVAQTGESGLAKCERPTAPLVPSGKHSDAAAMKDTSAELKIYFNGINAYILCLRDEYNRARAEAEQISAQWKDAQARFKTR